jgi:hypothetical protein
MVIGPTLIFGAALVRFPNLVIEALVEHPRALESNVFLFNNATMRFWFRHVDLRKNET